MRVQLKHTTIVLLSVTLTMASCVTVPAQSPVVFPLDAPDNVSPLNVEDQRKPAEKMLRPRRSGSPIYRLGDENFSPDRLKVLARRFQNTLAPSYAEKTIGIEYFEVTIFRPPRPSRPGGPAVVGGGVPGIVGGLIAKSVIASTQETRETIIVVCEIRGAVGGRSFKGSSDRVVPDPKADLFDAVGAVVREAIDDAADNLLKTLP